MEKNALKIGVLGGGQLGRMMQEAISKWNLDIHYLDAANAPIRNITKNHHIGDFRNFNDVMDFGKDKDILTVEIESVNLEALKQLKKQGKVIHPNPDALKIINDKGLQKLFYEGNGFPSSPFSLFKDAKAIHKALGEGEIEFPFVQKARTGGYDGRGVAVISDASKLDLLMDTPSIIEEKVEIEKEVALIVARNENGEIVTYDPVEMVFDPDANLVDYLFAPADVTLDQLSQMKAIGEKLIEALDICGLLAIEFFIDLNQKVLINEVAPRPHNSGHHTIEACHCSQFEMHIRAILNLPLGNTTLNSPAAMMNLLGSSGHAGPAVYDGFENALSNPDLHLHFYGKTETKPFRKMGHMTLLGKDVQNLKKAIPEIKQIINIRT